ncbi:recombinase family protein [Niabella beijingensis]|uniref:recombinase family protein n=1 Tax=Niabella beijingensis TaxID=2872700 RepID=UPI001CBB054D
MFVWIYTRVSSKEQFEKNSSVENQLEANRSYAKQMNFSITEEFGGTYESAKSDFTRKEFKRLIDKVKSSRKRPYAILVYKMSRFSRSGGNAIGLVNRLVEELGVHLIEVSTGLTTTSERGKAAIYESLFHAYKENIERKEIIIPGMKRKLLKGFWLGNVPLGYDQYGPRVKREKFFSKEQKVVINNYGQLLREAWTWKASGIYNDAQILSKLSARGLKLTPQKISAIWKKPFYCGVLAHHLLEEPVKGNWEALVSIDDFKKVQEILSGHHSGYKHQKEEENRPLLRLLRCNNCGSYLVGYYVSKKDLHYYRCLKCPGVSLTAKTPSLRARRVGAFELFQTFLRKFEIPKSIFPLVLKQLTKLFNHHQKENLENDHLLEIRLKEFEKKKKELTIRRGLGEIDTDTYNITLEHITIEMQSIYKELNTVPSKISNLEKLLNSALKKLQKLSVYWGSSDLSGKRMLHKILFPEGVFYIPEKHEYLTKKINGFLLLTSSILAEYTSNKNRNSLDFSESSGLVARTRIELVSRV